MAKLFIVLALVLAGVSAVFGFLAKGNVDKLQTTLTLRKDELAKTKTKLGDTETKLATTTTERDAANKLAEEKGMELDKKTMDLTKANESLANATTQLDAKMKEVTDLTAKLEEAMKGPKTPAGMPEDPRVAALTGDLQKAQAELAEQKALVEQVTKQGSADKERVGELEKKEKLRQAGVTRPGLSGRILAVNPGWNFVVINVGDKQGVLVNSPLLVIRGNTPVARLRITSVEPSQSIADVIPGSVTRGVTVQPGDTVIFEGSRTEAKPSGEAEAVTPPLPARP